MVKEIEVALTPEGATHPKVRLAKCTKILGVSESEIKHIEILRRSIDARKYPTKIRLRCLVFVNEEKPDEKEIELDYKNVSNKKRVNIIGSGPAGLFAALRLIELGFKPIVLERGKDVSNRRKDLSILHRKHEVNPDSNYCFGEGGAGTYSDGKLYTRSKKRGNLKRILDILVAFGSTEDILIDAHPHIGTNKLPKIIASMRKTILQSGGEFHFETRIEDLEIRSGKVVSVIDQNQNKFEAEATVLATGHSARDIYYLLDRKGLSLEAKSFAMGVRIEHPQPLIDSIQYHCGPQRERHLPSASYSLVHQVKDRGVYSFCMCPGGFVVPAATTSGEVVVNGMSTSTRDSRYANSGMVVAIDIEDLRLKKKYGVFAGLEYQKQLEQLAWEQGGKTQTAPAQRMVDFVNGKHSTMLNGCSYIPGITSSDLHDWLPDHIGKRLKHAFRAFGKKMKGYYTNEAQLLGVESRTSSPVRIPRDNKTLQHPDCEGLFPSGEGGGYAGGIVSAAMDGERCAEAVVSYLEV
ncbi:MAG: FAD-binding protein [Crocinitomicaceae bacterium]|nr:FAD-binding protein [Crocinitomicaceae bacterium]